MRTVILGIFYTNILLAKTYLVEVDDQRMANVFDEKIAQSDHNKEVNETVVKKNIRKSDHKKATFKKETIDTVVGKKIAKSDHNEEITETGHDENMKLSEHDKEITEIGHDENMKVSEHNKEITETLVDKKIAKSDHGKELTEIIGHDEKKTVSEHNKEITKTLVDKNIAKSDHGKEITETGRDEKKTVSEHDKEITKTGHDSRLSGSDYRLMKNENTGCSNSNWCRHVWVQKCSDCNGVYTLMRRGLPWASEKPAYKLQSRKRFIYFRNGKFLIGEINRPPMFSSAVGGRPLRRGWINGWTRGLSWSKKNGVAPSVSCICLPVPVRMEPTSVTSGPTFNVSMLPRYW